MRLLIDISNLIYRSAYKLKLSDRHGNNTGAVFGSLKSLGHLAEVWRPEEMVVCWDGKHGAARRIAEYPEYKNNRKRDKEFVEDLIRQKAVLRALLDCLPVIQIGHQDIEADDTIAVLASFLRMERVGIVTSDRDLYSLATSRCCIVQPGGKREKLLLEPHQYLAYKVLVGDASDNIKGVPRIGDKRAMALLAEHRTLDGVVAGIGEVGGPAGISFSPEEYAEAVKVVERNKRLMTPGLMLDASERTALLDQYRHGRLLNRVTDTKRFRAELMKVGFTSIVQRLSGWLAPFRGMERHAAAKTKTESGIREEGRSRGEAVKGARANRWAAVIRNVEPCASILRAADGGPSTAERGRTAAGYGHISAEAPMGMATASRLPSTTGAVRSTRLLEQDATRHGRAGDPFAPVFRDAEVLRKERERAREAVFLLPLFRKGERWAWLKTRPTEELSRVVSLIERALRNPDKKLPKPDVAFIAALEEAYTTEPPPWM